MKTAGYMVSSVAKALTPTLHRVTYLPPLPKAGIVRTKDLKNWERLPNLISKSQQRNVVLHPEFVNGKYALYTRPQDSFIDAGKRRRYRLGTH